MPQSRRSFLATAARITALGAVPSLARTADVTFTTSPFTLGVASGYPEPMAVVLWTRLAPDPLAPGGAMPPQVVAVDWEVAEDEALRNVVRRGRTYADPEWAHSVHVEVTGLEPARPYWYRFVSGGAESPVGRTRTAPAPDAATERLKLAVASCQQYEGGYYAAYRAMVADDVDLVLHVGDYIYENRGIARVRAHDALECYTLDDYRQRYAIYKSDPDLQTAHAAIPWMTIPDDHEVDNDYAADHSEDNDDPAVFLARRAAAYQAYYEHMPVPRRMVPYGPNARLHARRGFGDLADIFVLDGRQYRDRQSCGFGLVDPCAELHAEQRSMLGRVQEQWLEERMAQSRARWNLFAQQTVFAYVDQRSGREIGFWSDGWSGYPAARRRLTGLFAGGMPANPVILSGDVHAFLVNDVHVDGPGSALVATELVTSSISSPGPAQGVLDGWVSENANIRLAREARGYLRLLLEHERLSAELIAVEDVRRADSPTRVLAAFEVEAGHAGVVR